LYRLATKAGVVHPCMNLSSLLLVPSSVAHVSLGLQGVMDNNMALIKDGTDAWKNPKPIRTHANAASMAGGPRNDKVPLHG
jgi:hypothetical protein